MNQHQKRIIVTGASGVGKTTLVEKLAPHLSLSVIPELGRAICKQLGYERVGDIPDQEDFKQQVLEAQIATEDTLGDFISDRSTIDCWVLWQRWNICKAMTYDTEAYYEKSRAQAQRYTQIIYIPPMFAVQDDGFRWTDTDYQKQIDRLVKATIHEWQLSERTYMVQSDDPALRLEEVFNWLEERS